MSKIGIISGGGKLPVLIGNNLIKKNYEVIFFVIEAVFPTSKAIGIFMSYLFLLQLPLW